MKLALLCPQNLITTLKKNPRKILSFTALYLDLVCRQTTCVLKIFSCQQRLKLKEEGRAKK